MFISRYIFYERNLHFTNNSTISQESLPLTYTDVDEWIPKPTTKDSQPVLPVTVLPNQNNFTSSHSSPITWCRNNNVSPTVQPQRHDVPSSLAASSQSSPQFPLSDHDIFPTYVETKPILSVSSAESTTSKTNLSLLVVGDQPFPDISSNIFIDLPPIPDNAHTHHMLTRT